jgi:hypothetical protein
MQRQYTYTSLQQCTSCFFSIPFRPSKNKNTENSLCCFAANGGGGSGACAWLLSRLGAGLHRPSALPHRERFLLITISTTIQLRSPPGSAAAPLFHRRPLSAILFILPSTPRREDQCALLVTILNSVESGFVHRRRHNSTPSTIGVACSSLSSS